MQNRVTFLFLYLKDKTYMNNPLCQSLTPVTTFKGIPLQPWRSLLAELKVRMDKSGLPWNSLAAVMGVVLSRLMQYDLYHLCCCTLSFLSNTWQSVEDLNKLQRYRVGWEKYFSHLEQEKEVFVFSRSLFRERSGEEREENRSTSSLGRKRL